MKIFTKKNTFWLLFGLLLSLIILINDQNNRSIIKENMNMSAKQESLSSSLKELLTVIRAVEKAYPKDDWKTTAIRLRKTHYDSALWNLVLLKSEDVKPADTNSGVPAAYIERLQRGDVGFIDPKGNSVDMGHIWALVNALSQQNLNKIVGDLTGLEVQDAISWSGDIGSAVAAYALQGKDKKISLAQNFHNLAGSSDLYGDVDGFGVYFQDVDQHWSLSQRIEHFYQNNLSQRFEYFAQGVNLKLDNKNGKFSVNQASIDSVLLPQIKEFTLFWTLHVCKMKKMTCLKEEIEGKIYTQSEMQEAIDLYLEWLDKAQN